MDVAARARASRCRRARSRWSSQDLPKLAAGPAFSPSAPLDTPSSAGPEQLRAAAVRLGDARRVGILVHHAARTPCPRPCRSSGPAQQRLALAVERIRRLVARRIARRDVVEAQNRGLEVPLLEVTVREPVSGIVGVVRSRVSLQELAEAVNARLVVVAAPRVVRRRGSSCTSSEADASGEARPSVLAGALRRGRVAARPALAARRAFFASSSASCAWCSITSRRPSSAATCSRSASSSAETSASRAGPPPPPPPALHPAHLVLELAELREPRRSRVQRGQRREREHSLPIRDRADASSPSPLRLAPVRPPGRVRVVAAAR